MKRVDGIVEGIVAGTLVVAMTAACSGNHAPSPANAVHTAYGCAPVSVDKWADEQPGTPGEPTVRLPQPANWRRVNWHDPGPVRLMLRDDNLGKRLAPTVVVTVTEDTGRVPNAQAVLDAVRANINRSGATDLADTPGSVCGFAATTFTYKSDQGAPAPRSIRAVVVAPEYDNKLFDVVVTAQAGDAGDQAYLPDAQTILTGMEIKAPAH